MKCKIVLIAVFFSVAVFSSAQDKLPAYFHASTQVCNFLWATNYDYAIKLYPDSIVSFLLFESEYKGGQNTIIRKEYKGKYNVDGDTVHIQYAYSKENRKGDSWETVQSSSQQGLSFGTIVETKKPTIIKQVDVPAGIPIQKDGFDAPVIFIMKNKTMTPLESYIPALITASLIKMEALETVFSNWDNGPKRF